MWNRYKKRRQWRPYYKRVLTDAQVVGALKLRGYKEPYHICEVAKVIKEAFGYRLLRYTRMKSSMGTEFGRWEIG